MNKRKVFGVGVNDANYVTQTYEFYGNINGKKLHKQLWICPFYAKWRHMLCRAYSGRYKDINVTYKGCVVCEDWLTFSKFRTWMENQNWEGKQLDKDLLGDGKLYSPETCCLVSHKVNCFFVSQANHRGLYMIGVCTHKLRPYKYLAQVQNPSTGKQERLGWFDTELEAHKAWQTRKHEYACQLAELQEDSRVADALRQRYAPDKDWTKA